MHNLGLINTILLLFTLIVSCCALECYVCDNQEEFLGKCVKSIKTCEQGEDVCLTEIRWGSMPYWQQGALKQFYVSKRCATRENCINYRSSNMHLCTHVWYEDWKCSDCCKGDRCNYYVMSGADLRKISVISLIMSISLLYFVL